MVKICKNCKKFVCNKYGYCKNCWELFNLKRRNSIIESFNNKKCGNFSTDLNDFIDVDKYKTVVVENMFRIDNTIQKKIRGNK